MAELLDRGPIDDIRRIEHATGRTDVFSGFVLRLEASLAGFAADFSARVARGDGPGAVRAAHTLKGTSRQLGAEALGELFADIELSAKAADYDGAKRKFEAGADLITRSIEALKKA